MSIVATKPFDGVFTEFLAERLAHPPLGARANVERGVEVVITENHVNRAAPSGWMERLVRLFIIGRLHHRCLEIQVEARAVESQFLQPVCD